MRDVLLFYGKFNIRVTWNKHFTRWFFTLNLFFREVLSNYLMLVSGCARTPSSEASIYHGHCRWADMAADGRVRKNVKPGIEVLVVLKRDQRTGKLTRGKVKDVLTNSRSHPRGIKVRLQDGRIGRVQEIVAQRG